MSEKKWENSLKYKAIAKDVIITMWRVKNEEEKVDVIKIKRGKIYDDGSEVYSGYELNIPVPLFVQIIHSEEVKDILKDVLCVCGHSIADHYEFKYKGKDDNGYEYTKPYTASGHCSKCDCDEFKEFG
ncbi:MAG: hypothetical protein QXV17_10715 [Candidatus Micrarchaeaceae archaeon]